MKGTREMAVLAASVASEINDELTLLLNQLSASLELLGGEHPAREEVTGARRAAERCGGITRALLDFTRREGGEARPVPLGRILDAN